MIKYYKQYYLKEALHRKSPTNGVRQGELMAFFGSYYVDDLAFIMLYRRNVEKATSLIAKHFHRFGIKIHFGIKSDCKASKTEAMFIPVSHRGYKKCSEFPSDLVVDINLY